MGIRPSMQKVMLKYVFEGRQGLTVCELGDQYAGQKEGPPILARRLYEKWGCSRYVAIDANGRGDVTGDLNLRLVNIWPGPRGPEGITDLNFDVVTDFGTGEHIWDQAQVWRTMHDLLRPGGLLVFDRPTQGYHGHCFYLTNAAVIAAFCHANRYEVIWAGRALTTRGELLRGVLRKPDKDLPYQIPQQGRYFKHLAILTKEERLRGPDWKNANLRAHKIAGKEFPKLADEREAKGIWAEEDEA